jgi:hypothetical protein
MERFHDHQFLIKHPTVASVWSTEHCNDDHKHGDDGASVTAIVLSTWWFHAATRIKSGWLYSSGDIPNVDLFYPDATTLELLRINIDSVCTIVVRRFFPSMLWIHAPLRIVENLIDSHWLPPFPRGRTALHHYHPPFCDVLTNLTIDFMGIKIRFHFGGVGELQLKSSFVYLFHLLEFCVC